MKNIYLVVALMLILPAISPAQPEQKAEAERLVAEGVVAHDAANYSTAISKYDKALELDPYNLLALHEKSFTLHTIKKYDEAIKCCRTAIEKHPGAEDLKAIFVTYGNCLDVTKGAEAAIEVYDEGLTQFPDYYHLHYNKGITYAGLKKYDDAILCFQKSVTFNPEHASSHNALARMLYITDKNIPALLAYCRFLVIEPGSARAAENLVAVQKILSGGVEKTGKNSMTINLSMDDLVDTTENGKMKENNFNSVNLMMKLGNPYDMINGDNKKIPAAEKFAGRFKFVCAALKNTEKDNHGFYWEYYAPYFAEMEEKNLVEPFGYIAYFSMEDKKVNKWVKNNQDELSKFYVWSKSYPWPEK